MARRRWRVHLRSGVDTARDNLINAGIALLLFAISITPPVLHQRFGVAMPTWLVVLGLIGSGIFGSTLILYGVTWRPVAQVYVVRSPNGQAETWTKKLLDQLDLQDRGILFSLHSELGEWYDRECWKEFDRYTRRAVF